MAKIPVTRQSTKSKVEEARNRAHYLQVSDGAAAPPCQYPGCHRRAQLAYRDRKTGLRAFRPWCVPHRPTHGPYAAPKVAIPRPYLLDPESPRWSEKERCPYCNRKREPGRNDGLRRTCRLHRAQGKIFPRKKKVVMRPKLELVTKPTPPRKHVNPHEVVYHEGRKREVLTIHSNDWLLLVQAWRSGMGHYTASTMKELTRKYPTSAIVALFARWEKGRKRVLD